MSQMKKDSAPKPPVYQIKVHGRLDERWTEWLSDMNVAYESGCSTLTGPVTDQARLRGILTAIWNTNLTVISINRIEPNYDDPYVKHGGE